MEESDRSIWPLFWFEKVVEGTRLSYRKLSLLIPTSVVFGHFLISAFTGGLDRFLNDAGAITVILGWFLVLAAIRYYADTFRRLVRVLPSITDYTSDEIARAEDFVFGKGTYLFGLVGSILGFLLLWISVGPSKWPSGWTEAPYDGSVVFSQEYTSIPAVIWSTAFWFLFEFIVGGVFWMSLANIFFMKKIGHRLEVNLLDTNHMVSVRTLGTTALAAILMPATLLVFTPAVFSALQRQNLWGIFFFGYAGYTLILVAIFGFSVYEIHVTMDRRKRESIDGLQSEFYEIHNQAWSRSHHIVREGEQRKLLWLYAARSLLVEVPTWPFGTETAFRVSVILLSPTLSALLQYGMSSVLK